MSGDSNEKTKPEATKKSQKKANKKKTSIKDNIKIELFENAISKLQQFKQNLSLPFQVYAKRPKSGVKIYRVVGYDAIIQRIILTKDGEKYYHLKEDAIVKNEKEFEEAKLSKKVKNEGKKGKSKDKEKKKSERKDKSKG